MNADTTTQLDERDAAILERRLVSRDIEGSDTPMVGDWLRFQDGRMERVAHVWPADWHADNIATVQPTHPKFGYGSIYLGEHGGTYSGALDDGIKLDRIVATDETRPSAFWFFHHDQHRAHNGITVEFQVCVWEVYDAAD